MTLGLRSVLLSAAAVFTASGVAHAQTAMAPSHGAAQTGVGLTQSAGAQAQVGAGPSAGAQAEVGAAPSASAGAQVGVAPGAGAEAQVGAGATPGAQAEVGATTAPPLTEPAGPPPMEGAEVQAGVAPGMGMQGQAEMYPPRPWQKHRLIGGHIGVAVPIVTVADDTEVIGDDYFDLGLSSGVAARINPCWSFDFEFIAFNALKSKRGPTRLVVDPGIFRAWGSFAMGLRAAVVVGGPNVNNFGLVPVLYKGFQFSEDSPVGMYLELDLPVFVNDAHENRVTFTPQLQLGTSF